MSDRSLLNDILDPLTDCLDATSAQRVAEFGIDPAVRERVNSLAEKANEGLLSDGDRAEYEELVNATDFIAILKAKAQRRLASSTCSG
ncbi:MAG TPA: hypothetical protein VGL53_23835 [Bryobacteraceae bacterium]|jgi:hypothetical protein